MVGGRGSKLKVTTSASKGLSSAARSREKVQWLIINSPPHGHHKGALPTDGVRRLSVGNRGSVGLNQSTTRSFVPALVPSGEGGIESPLVWAGQHARLHHGWRILPTWPY